MFIRFPFLSFQQNFGVRFFLSLKTFFFKSFFFRSVPYYFFRANICFNNSIFKNIIFFKEFFSKFFKSLHGIFDFHLMLNYMKKTEKKFNLNFLNFYNFIKKFLTSFYWHFLDRTKKRIFVFNSKYKSLYGIYHIAKFFNFTLLKQVFVNRFFFSCMEHRKYSLLSFKHFLNVSKFNNNFFFIFRFLSKGKFFG